jgi:hypothetical protein
MVYQLERKVVSKPVDRESYSPDWKCYCCHDTGKIAPTNIKIIILDFDKNVDASPVCQKQGCFAGSWIHGASDAIKESFDFRFTPEICEQLDQIERSQWKENLRLWHEMRVAKKDPLAENVSRLKDMGKQIIGSKDLTAQPKRNRNKLSIQELEEISRTVVAEQF